MRSTTQRTVSFGQQLFYFCALLVTGEGEGGSETETAADGNTICARDSHRGASADERSQLRKASIDTL